MLLKGDRIFKRQNHVKKGSFLDSYSYREKKKSKSPQKHQNKLQQNQKVEKQKFKDVFSSINITTPTKQTRGRLLSFQNDYSKAATRKLIILDQRKIMIKEKIKGKVMEQLGDLLKRMEQVSNEQNNVEIKEESKKQQLLEVKIKGNSVKRSLRNSLSFRPQFLKQQKIRSFDNRARSEIKQKQNNKKIIISDLSPKFKSILLSPASKIILRDVSPRKFTRKIHSALDELSRVQKKSSWQIEPWNNAEDF